jgi:hypothetical protein
VIEEKRLWEFDYENVMDLLRHHYKLPLGTYSATGVRAVDSPQRWAAIKQHGPVNEKKQTFFPIFDWRKDRLIAEISDAGIKLPREYRLFGRTFDGIDYRFLKVIKDNCPEDYTRILEWFPLADLAVRKIEYRMEYYAKLGQAVAKTYRAMGA